MLAHLQQLGITRNEARVYLALLEYDEATAAELGDRSGVPRSKIYAMLRKLDDKGFALPLDGQVACFKAVQPNVALKRWITQREHERESAADADHRVLSELSHLLPTTARGQASAVTPASIEAVSGRARIAEASEHLLGAAQTRILMVQRPPFFQPPPRWNKLEVEAVRRGVEVRVIYSRDAIHEPARYKPLLDAGAELRVLETPPMKLISADGRRALVALRDPSTGAQAATSAVIQHPDLVSAIDALFDKEWDRADDLITTLIEAQQA